MKIDEIENLIGKAVLVATKTTTGYRIYTGRLRLLTDNRLAARGPSCLTLEEAAWIPDTGRWREGLETGHFREVEPYPQGSIDIVIGNNPVEIIPWPHPLPRTPK